MPQPTKSFAFLDVFYARAYGLTRDELRYILNPADARGAGYPSETFRVLKEKEIRQHGEYRTCRLVLAAWDRMEAKTGKNLYQLAYNRNHDAATRFVTLAHELAHLYLGHLGLDAGRRVPDRRDTPHALMEVEAEMAANAVETAMGFSAQKLWNEKA